MQLRVATCDTPHDSRALRATAPGLRRGTGERQVVRRPPFVCPSIPSTPGGAEPNAQARRLACRPIAPSGCPIGAEHPRVARMLHGSRTSASRQDGSPEPKFCKSYGTSPGPAHRSCDSLRAGTRRRAVRVEPEWLGSFRLLSETFAVVDATRHRMRPVVDFTCELDPDS